MKKNILLLVLLSVVNFAFSQQQDFFDYLITYEKVKAVDVAKFIENEADTNSLGYFRPFDIFFFSYQKFSKEERFKILKIFLKNNVDINKTSHEIWDRQTPLHFAVNFRIDIDEKEKVIKLLLDYGANPSKESGENLTVFETYLKNIAYKDIGYSEEILEMFIDFGVDLNKKVSKKSYLSGLTPLGILLYSGGVFGTPQGEIFRNSYKAAFLLAQNGADVSITIKKKIRIPYFYFILREWKHPLNICRMHKYRLKRLTLFEMVLYFGIELNKPCCFLSCKNVEFKEASRFILLMLDEDININKKIFFFLNGLSPFQYLVAEKVWQIAEGVKILEKCVAKNANLEMKDKKGKQPIDYIDEDTSEEVIMLLTPKSNK